MLLPPRGNKERKGSENNIIFENKLSHNVVKKDSNSNLAEKERRGSCTNLWMNNFSQKNLTKPPRFSMVDEPQENLGARRVKNVRRGFDENNHFSMEEVPEQ